MGAAVSINDGQQHRRQAGGPLNAAQAAPGLSTGRSPGPILLRRVLRGWCCGGPRPRHRSVLRSARNAAPVTQELQKVGGSLSHPVMGTGLMHGMSPQDHALRDGITRSDWINIDRTLLFLPRRHASPQYVLPATVEMTENADVGTPACSTHFSPPGHERFP